PRGLNLAVRRDAFLAVGGFNLRLGPRGDRPSVGEESDLCLRLLACGHEIRYVPGAAVEHLVDPARLHPRWFFQRAFWTGWSEAMVGLAHRPLRNVAAGSTDPRTLAILEAAAREPGVSVHRTPNGGPSRARNLGVERARGAYVLPLDADDYLAPAFLAKTVPLLAADPALGVVYTWVGLVGGHHGVWRTGGFSVTDLLSRCTIHGSSLYRRKLW